MKGLIAPKYFFAGLIFAFILCSIAGYLISQKARFNHFDRFFSHISASLDYYPTASELLATAEHKIDPNKILVLVGGSSIARGEGQNNDELWSKKLQEILGNKYQVLNYAYNGAGFGAFAGVAYRMLKERYPKIIYVSSCSFSESRDIDGDKYYKYMFWDAYYKRLFHPDPAEKKLIYERQKKEFYSNEIELHLMNILDSGLYFRSLWNWVSYRYFFTVWNGFAQPHALKPRRHAMDANQDNKARAEEIKKTKFKYDADAIIASHYSNLLDANNNLIAEKKESLYESYNTIFSPQYRQNSICFLTAYNPAYIAQLNKNDKKGYEIYLKSTKKIIESLKYNVIQPKNLVPDDYVDLQHYVKSGGYKLAQQIAPQVELVSKRNHY